MSKFTICFDTLCTGYEPIHVESDGVREPMTFETEKEAQAEIDSDPEFYDDCFICTVEEIGHKTIFYGESHANEQ